MWVTRPAWLFITFLVVLILFWIARISMRGVWLRAKPLVWFLLVIGLYVAWADGWYPAAAAMLRLASLVMLGLLVTLTTPLSAMMDVVTVVMRPLERLGLVRAERVSLAFGMTLRMVPELYSQWNQIREAQAARGLESHPVALIVPMLVRTLKRADDMAEAIDARLVE
jgi:biotin transport system permease protein